MKTDDFKLPKGIHLDQIKRDGPLPSFKMDLVRIFRMIVVVGFIVGVCGNKLQANTPSYEPSMEPTVFVPTYIATNNPSYLSTSTAPSIEPGIPTARPTLTSFPSIKPTAWPSVEAGAPTIVPTIPVVTYIEANQVKENCT